MTRVNIGVVGYGGIAKIHAIAAYAMQVLHDCPFQPAFLKAYRREKTTDSQIFQEIVTSIEDLVADPELDLIDICTPNYLHYEQVKLALQHNKAVYCEKPLALNYRQARALVQLAEDKQLLNQVALMYRFMPAVVRARDYIASGNLGEIIHFKFGLYHKGYLNDRPLSWREQMKYAGGGALIDLGIHMADLLRFLLGDVHSLRAELQTPFKERTIPGGTGAKGKVDVDQYAKINVQLGQGGSGIIECSRISSDLRESTVIEIYGTKGSIKITSDEPRYPTIHRHFDNLCCTGEIGGQSSFGEFCNKLYPSEKLSLGSAVDLHFASLYNMLFNLTKGKVVHAETPTFYEAGLAQKVIQMALTSHQENNRRVFWEEF